MLNVNVTEKNSNKRSRLVHSEQNSVSRMEDLVNKFSKSSEPVVDLFSGMFAFSMSCWGFLRYSPVVGCDVDSDCFIAVTKALFETSARYVLNERSEILGIDEVVNACEVLVRALDEL